MGSEDKKTWDDAGGICQLFGSHLLQIDNMAENSCLLEYAQKQGVTEAYWWHSGNDIEWEGVYRQADGNLLTWQPLWLGKNPNEGRRANCLVFDCRVMNMLESGLIILVLMNATIS